MIPYAAQVANLDRAAKLIENGWRFLVTAGGVTATHKSHYAIDNGAWAAFVNETDWYEKSFHRLVDRLGADADWVVAPDIVEGGAASLARSVSWLPWLLERTPRILIPVQDGMQFEDFEDLVGPRVGVFVGGSTDWKIASIVPWGRWAAARNVWCHIGRVNSCRRIDSCAQGFVTSFDGSGVSRYTNAMVPRLRPAIELANVQPILL